MEETREELGRCFENTNWYNIIHRLLKIHRLYNIAMHTDIYIYVAKRIQIGHNIEKYYYMYWANSGYADVWGSQSKNYNWNNEKMTERGRCIWV